MRWIEHVGQWIGARPDSEFDLALLAERRLPTDVVDIMTRHGLTSTEVHSLVIPLRTFKSRTNRRERLSREESDRAIRAARVLAQAESTFGSPQKALAWMRDPKARFGGRTPMELLESESGGRLVEEMLVQIDEGMFA